MDTRGEYVSASQFVFSTVFGMLTSIGLSMAMRPKAASLEGRYDMALQVSDSYQLVPLDDIPENANLLSGHTSRELQYGLNLMDSITEAGEKIEVSIVSNALPSEEDLRQFIVSAAMAGIEVSYPSTELVEGVYPTTTFTITKTNPTPGITSVFPAAALIAIIPTVMIVGLIGFGIFKIESITKALVPILLITIGGIIVIAGIMTRKPVLETAAKYRAQNLPKVEGRFEPAVRRPTRDEVEVDTWKERDRLGIWVNDKKTGKTIAEWWDEDARQMFEDGFFKPGVPELSHEKPGREFIESVLSYLEDVGTLQSEYQPATWRDKPTGRKDVRRDNVKVVYQIRSRPSRYIRGSKVAGGKSGFVLLARAEARDTGEQLYKFSSAELETVSKQPFKDYDEFALHLIDYLEKIGIVEKSKVQVMTLPPEWDFPEELPPPSELPKEYKFIDQNFLARCRRYLPNTKQPGRCPPNLTKEQFLKDYATPEQRRELDKFENWQLVEVHDDCDLTFRVPKKNQLYVITTDGEIFAHYTGKQALEKILESEFITITDPGDAKFRKGDVVSLGVFMEENDIIKKKGGKPAAGDYHIESKGKRGGNGNGSNLLDWLGDSPEYLAQTIDLSGWRQQLDEEFQVAIARSRK